MSAAVNHILRQMQHDARLAWLIGPGSRTYELLTEEAARKNGLDLEELRQQYEATLKFEPWPSDLQVEIDPQAILLGAPCQSPACSCPEFNSYDNYGNVWWRNSDGPLAPYWQGFERRKAVLGFEGWTSDDRYYVPDNFGYLVGVPGPRLWGHGPCVSDIYVTHTDNFGDLVKVPGP